MTQLVSVYSKSSNYSPVYANQTWGCKFDGTFAIGAIADSGVHNGKDFYAPITGIDSQGYNVTTDIANAFNCVGKTYTLQTLYILTGNNVALANVTTYAESTLTTMPAYIGSSTVPCYQNDIKDRFTPAGNSGGQPQVHLHLRRGLNEASQPAKVTKQYISFVFKLPANLLAMLSHTGSVAANWFEVFERKNGFQYFSLGNYYYYAYGDFRIKLEVLQVAGQLLYSVAGDNAGNTQKARFDGSITGTTLTVTNVTTNADGTNSTILDGAKLVHASITANTKIVNQLTSTEGTGYLGRKGTYTVDTSHAATGALTTIDAYDPSSASAGALATFWNDTSYTVTLDDPILCEMYFESPTSQAATSEGRVWIALTPKSTGIRTTITNRTGQSAGAYLCGFNNNPESRYFFAPVYSGGGAPGGSEPLISQISDLKVYDNYPFAPSTLT